MMIIGMLKIIRLQLNILEHLKIMSARNSNNQEFSLNEKYKECINKEIEFLNTKGKNKENKTCKNYNLNLFIDFAKIKR